MVWHRHGTSEGMGVLCSGQVPFWGPQSGLQVGQQVSRCPTEEPGILPLWAWCHWHCLLLGRLRPSSWTKAGGGRLPEVLGLLCGP